VQRTAQAKGSDADGRNRRTGLFGPPCGMEQATLITDLKKVAAGRGNMFCIADSARISESYAKNQLQRKKNLGGHVKWAGSDPVKGGDGRKLGGRLLG